MKAKYEDLVKKYQLPDVKAWLDLEEEVSLRGIRAAFGEKLSGFIEFTFVLVQPEDVPAMTEASQFSESELDNINALYKRLVLLSKDCLLADIASTDEEEVALIRTLAGEWPGIVSEIKDLVRRTKEAYTGSVKGSHDISYLG